VESASTLAGLFGALVLFLFPLTPAASRLRWVAGGFTVMGVGGLVFGYLQPLFGIHPDFNTSIYESLVIRAIPCALFAVGLGLASPPRFSTR
jgi:hypothetical protein